MQSFGSELVAAVGRHAWATAIASLGLLEGVGERQLPRVGLSFDRNGMNDGCGSIAGPQEGRLTGTRLLRPWRSEPARR